MDKKKEEIEYKLLKIEYLSYIFLIFYIAFGLIGLKFYFEVNRTKFITDYFFGFSEEFYLVIIIFIFLLLSSSLLFNTFLFIKYFKIKVTKIYLASLLGFILIAVAAFKIVELLNINFIIAYFFITIILHQIDLEMKRKFLPKDVYEVYKTFYGAPFKRILFYRLVPEIGESTPFLKKEKRKFKIILVISLLFLVIVVSILFFI